MENNSFILVVGAGISIDPPSNLPSWSGFYKKMLDGIKEKVLETLPTARKLLEPIDVNKLPVQCISEIIVRSGAGDSYFPLLTLLESARPNANHKAIVEMVKQRMVCAIITTNFDTLLERAFRQENIKLNVIISENDYAESFQMRGCNLFKIHGTVFDPTSLVDTVTQKYVGLSVVKRTFLKNLLKNYDVVFLGFSGADFSFDLDYIPIHEAVNNNHAIKWIKHPGSSTHDNVKLLQNEFSGRMHLQELNLSDYFKLNNIDYESLNTEVQVNEPIEASAKLIDVEIQRFLASEHLGFWGCVGYCIDILDKIGLDAQLQDFICICEDVIKTKPLDISASLTLFAIGNKMLKSDPDKSIDYFYTILRINGDIEEKLSRLSNRDLKLFKKENLNNCANVWNNLGLAYLQKENFSNAKSAFAISKEIAQSCGNKLILATALFNEVRINFRESNDSDKYIKELKGCEKEAKDAGDIQLLANILLLRCDIFLLLGEYFLVQEDLAKYDRLKSNISDSSLRVAFDICKAEYEVRLGENEKAFRVFERLFQDLKNDQSGLISYVEAGMIRLCLHYKPARAIILDCLKKYEYADIDNFFETEDNEYLENRLPSFILNASSKDFPWRSKVIFFIYNKRFSEATEQYLNGCLYYVHKKDYLRLEDVAKCMIHMSHQINDVHMISIAMYYLGCAKLELRSFREAEELFISVTKLNGAVSHNHLGWSYIELAKIMIQNNDIQSSKVYFNKGRELFLIKEEDPDQLISGGMAYAEILCSNRNFQEAIDIVEDLLKSLSPESIYRTKIISSLNRYKREVETSFDSNESNNLPEFIANKANEAHDRGNIKDAWKLINEAKKKYKKQGNLAGIGRCYNNMANYLMKENKTIAGVAYFEKSLKIKERLNDIAGVVKQMSNIIYTYIKMGDIENAICCAKKAEKKVTSLVHCQEIIYLYSILSSAYLSNGEYLKALVYAQKARSGIENSENIQDNDELAFIDDIIQSLQSYFSFSTLIKFDIEKFNEQLMEANRLQSIGKLDECTKILDELQKQNLSIVKYGQVEAVRGNVCASMKDFEKAISYYKSALAYFEKGKEMVEPNAEYFRQAAAYELSVMLDKLGKEEEAIELCRHELKNELLENQNRCSFLQSLSNRLLKCHCNSIHKNSDIFNEVMLLLTECTELSKDNEEANGIAHLSLGNLFILANEFSDAEKHLMIAEKTMYRINSKFLDVVQRNLRVVRDQINKKIMK